MYENYNTCGRDFFEYRKDGSYEEYAYTNTECETESITMSWELQNGVITVGNSPAANQDFVITTLDSTSFSFKARLVDVDEDGILDVVTVNARKYKPMDFDRYSYSFDREYEDHEDEMYLTWKPYDGVNDFKSYEIYRSIDGCSNNNAEKLATITSVDSAFYKDQEIPVAESICYFLKIKTNNGIVAESTGHSYNTKEIRVKAVDLKKPSVINETVHLN